MGGVAVLVQHDLRPSVSIRNRSARSRRGGTGNKQICIGSRRGAPPGCGVICYWQAKIILRSRQKNRFAPGSRTAAYLSHSGPAA